MIGTKAHGWWRNSKISDRKKILENKQANKRYDVVQWMYEKKSQKIKWARNNIFHQMGVRTSTHILSI